MEGVGSFSTCGIKRCSARLIFGGGGLPGKIRGCCQFSRSEAREHLSFSRENDDSALRFSLSLPTPESTGPCGGQLERSLRWTQHDRIVSGSKSLAPVALFARRATKILLHFACNASRSQFIKSNGIASRAWSVRTMILQAGTAWKGCAL